MKSNVVVAFVLVSIMSITVTSPSRVKAADWRGTLYIRADGSFEPSDAPVQRNQDVYNLTANIVSDVDFAVVIGRSNIILDGSGYTIRGVANSSMWGVSLTSQDNVTIKNATIREFLWGITVVGSNSTTISVSTVTNNTVDGIYLAGGGTSRLFGNIITGNGEDGIEISHSLNNTIEGNYIAANGDCGIRLSYQLESFSFYTAIDQDDLTMEAFPSYNVICKNTLAGNLGSGVSLSFSSNNLIYHNNFIENGGYQASGEYSTDNVWDYGYPSGGNYWSNYLGVDFKKGPYQNETGQDGIGDESLLIYGSDRDHYPLMQPLRGAGDLNLDWRVDLRDLMLMAKSYGSRSGEPSWNPYADVAEPWGVIGLTDLVTVAYHYGQWYS